MDVTGKVVRCGRDREGGEMWTGKVVRCGRDREGGEMWT